MIAYHFLKANMETRSSYETAWTIGEERTIKAKTLKLCVRGYHSSPSLFGALKYAPGPIACLVEVSEPEAKDTDKQVSRIRKLLVAIDVSNELREFACDCAEHALEREREAGREPDARSWKAIEVARAFIRGEAALGDLNVAANAANAAYDAAYATYATNAAYAAYAERQWQRERFDALVLPRLESAIRGDAS